MPARAIFVSFLDAFSYIKSFLVKQYNFPASPLKKPHSANFCRFPTHIATVKSALPALRYVTRTFDNNRLVALLTIFCALFAQRVVLPASVRAKEHTLLGLPMLASAHRLLTALSGSALGGSDFAALSFSRIDGFSCGFGSSFLPLLMMPSIMP